VSPPCRKALENEEEKMSSSFRTPSAVLVLAALALAGSPSLAGEEPRVDETKVPVIRVIVDHESNLALVPEGTVLPGGFQILSSADLRVDATDAGARGSSARRPLVFAYAPAERFAGLEAVEIPPDTRGEIVELGFPSERAGATRQQPARSPSWSRSAPRSSTR
jgi:hypothetical protein